MNVELVPTVHVQTAATMLALTRAPTRLSGAHYRPFISPFIPWATGRNSGYNPIRLDGQYVCLTSSLSGQHHWLADPDPPAPRLAVLVLGIQHPLEYDAEDAGS